MFFKRILLLFSLFVTLLLPSMSVAEQEEMYIGLIPEMNVFTQMERFKILADYLEQKTNIKIHLTILSRYGNIIESFMKKELDGAFLGSFTGAMAIVKLNLQPLARPVNPDGSTTYHGFIFVRKKSGIRNVKDMKGRTIAFVDRATTAGYIFPVAYFRKNGVRDIDSYFSEYYFAGSHDAAIYAVLQGEADIGAAKHSVYHRVKHELPQIEKDLAILAVSPNVPSNGLCVRKNLNESMKLKLKEALLNMEKDQQGIKILKRFGALGFVTTNVEDYSPVFRIAKDAGIDLKSYEYMNID